MFDIVSGAITIDGSGNIVSLRNKTSFEKSPSDWGNDAKRFYFDVTRMGFLDSLIAGGICKFFALIYPAELDSSYPLDEELSLNPLLQAAWAESQSARTSSFVLGDLSTQSYNPELARALLIAKADVGITFHPQ